MSTCKVVNNDSYLLTLAIILVIKSLQSLKGVHNYFIWLHSMDLVAVGLSTRVRD